MNFNQAVPIGSQRQYSEGTALASSRDSRSNSQLWKGNKATQEWQVGIAQALAKVSKEVSKMRRKPLGGGVGSTAATPTATGFPFEIYNVTNASDTSLNKTTFQIRAGLIGYRSAYNFEGDWPTTAQAYQNNFELPLIATGTDYTSSAPYEFALNWFLYSHVDPTKVLNYANTAPNTGGTVTIDAGGAPTLICSNIESGSNPNPENVQIVVPVSDVGSQGTSCAFWVQLFDSATHGPYTELWGQLNNTGEILIPSGAYELNATLIGYVTFPTTTSKGIITQVQSNHVLNRYLLIGNGGIGGIGGGGGANAGAQVFRGRLSGVPNSSTGKYIFFPGDVIIDDTAPVVAGAFTYFASWMLVFPPQLPSSDGGGLYNLEFAQTDFATATNAGGQKCFQPSFPCLTP